ncbi:hypothetical protein, partial [Actinomadura logoneensis]|uniref:hypothetical protein n=1 Tax=Actinomadura logoneensis TaxID=2293572 RepID=UPI0038B2BF74
SRARGPRLPGSRRRTAGGQATFSDDVEPLLDEDVAEEEEADEESEEDAVEEEPSDEPLPDALPFAGVLTVEDDPPRLSVR